MELNDVLDAISNGVCDGNLEAVRATTRDREQALARRNFHTIRIGAKARLKNLKPKYLVGAPVTVVEKNQTRLVVEIDKDWLDWNPQARSRFGTRPTVTPNMLDLIPDSDSTSTEGPALNV